METHANDEVGSPVTKPSHSHGCRPGALGEQLSHKEPGDGAGPDLEEGHKAIDGQHADVAHPGNTVLSGERTQTFTHSVNAQRWHRRETDQQRQSRGHDDGARAHASQSDHVERPTAHPLDQEQLLEKETSGHQLKFATRKEDRDFNSSDKRRSR